MGTPRHLCESYTVGMAFRQVGRGCLKVQLPGGQICLVNWQENTGGFDSQSSMEAFERRYSSFRATKSQAVRKRVSMIFLLCPICFAHRCRVLYRPNSDLWGCRHCHSISYRRDGRIIKPNAARSSLATSTGKQGPEDCKNFLDTARLRSGISTLECRDLILREKEIHKALSGQLARLVDQAA